MTNTFIKIWVHAVFGTKDSLPLINETLESKLYNYIKSQLMLTYKIEVKIVNGIENHIHILFLLNQNFAIKDIIQNIKGGSSHWINQNNLIESKFSWQTGYAAYSVSESNLKKAEEYIRNQKELHKKISFKEEYLLFIKKHKLTQ
ncbi:MAG: transposase [Bacteroidota bacterium]|nr:transposase [Bacteroidota bacterium]